jgi:hypothetical protein
MSLVMVIIIIGGVLWAGVAIRQDELSRRAQEYVVVYYPKGGPSKTYDGVHTLRYGTGYAEFVYMGKKVRLNGDMEITMK